MKSKFLIIIILFTVFCTQLQAQIRQGIVLDANTREPIVGASVFIKGTTIGTACNNEGVFDLQGFPKPPYQIHISAVGYETNVFEISDILEYDTITILLETKELEEFTINYNTGCDNNVPEWGESLGTINFATERVFWVTNGTMTQVWSDAVTATNCQKDNFNTTPLYQNHPYENSFHADCRSNPQGRNQWPLGDLFSWCAVYRFQDQLCPKPWRVPTKDDFANLDIILGGTGEEHRSYDVYRRYLSRWGTNTNSLSSKSKLMKELDFQRVYYWSLSEYDKTEMVYYEKFIAAYALDITFNLIGQNIPNIRPQTFSFKFFGHLLRCVR